MSVKVKYEVVREFKYGGKILQIGDEWVPGQGKWDEQILDGLENVRSPHTANPDTVANKFIRRVEMKPIPKRRGRTKKVSDK